MEGEVTNLISLTFFLKRGISLEIIRMELDGIDEDLLWRFKDGARFQLVLKVEETYINKS